MEQQLDSWDEKKRALPAPGEAKSRERAAVAVAVAVAVAWIHENSHRPTSKTAPPPVPPIARKDGGGSELLCIGKKGPSHFASRYTVPSFPTACHHVCKTKPFDGLFCGFDVVLDAKSSPMWKASAGPRLYHHDKTEALRQLRGA